MPSPFQPCDALSPALTVPGGQRVSVRDVGRLADFPD